jgi:hypothetical protein
VKTGENYIILEAAGLSYIDKEGTPRTTCVQERSSEAETCFEFARHLYVKEELI